MANKQRASKADVQTTKLNQMPEVKAEAANELAPSQNEVGAKRKKVNQNK
ncbi:hypothetical protein [Paenibacillus sp. GCM10027626]